MLRESERSFQKRVFNEYRWFVVIGLIIDLMGYVSVVRNADCHTVIIATIVGVGYNLIMAAMMIAELYSYTTWKRWF